MGGTGQRWPDHIRQWKAIPVAGGWGVTYKQDGIHLSTGTATPITALTMIINARLANKLDPQIEETRFWLEKQWYARAPKRFTRPPRLKQEAKDLKPIEESSEEQAIEALGQTLHLVPHSKKDLDYWSPIILAMINSPTFDCQECVKIARQVFVEKPENWHYVLYARLYEHIGRTPMPLPLVKKQFKW